MIIVRSPMRISLGGGGTDLPSYYREHGGFVIAAAIDKYVYITLHETFEQEIVVKYSKMEKVKTVDEVQHPIVREALKMVEVDDPHLEIASHADIPAGTGLGSSSSFTVALLKALYAYKREGADSFVLANKACEIEIDRLGEPIGKQDQNIAAYGGLTCFHFYENDTIMREPLRMDSETLHNLEDGLMLFFTGYARSASDVLRIQDEQSKKKTAGMLHNLYQVRVLGGKIRQALEHGELREFASLMDEHWCLKQKRSSNMSNDRINELYAMARHHGALGGKLVGAGGGGFLLFYTEDKIRLRHAMLNAGLKETRFRFDHEGTKVIAQ